MEITYDTCKYENCTTTFPRKINRNNKKLKEFCSTGCIAASKRALVVCNNPECSTEFEAPRFEKRKYCSQTCSAIVSNKAHPKRTPSGICSACGSPAKYRKALCQECLDVVVDAKDKVKSLDPPALIDPCALGWIESSPKIIQYNPLRGTMTTNPTTICTYNGCGNTKGSKSETCRNCSSSYRKDRTIEDWLSGKYPGGSSSLNLTVRRYVLQINEFKCNVCSIAYFHPVDGLCINEIDHIDGDASNHRPENLQVLCPTHHAMTPTHRARNRGKGRRVYYKKIVPKGEFDHSNRVIVDLDEPGAVVVELSPEENTA